MLYNVNDINNGLAIVYNFMRNFRATNKFQVQGDSRSLRKTFENFVGLKFLFESSWVFIYLKKNGHFWMTLNRMTVTGQLKCAEQKMTIWFLWGGQEDFSEQKKNYSKCPEGHEYPPAGVMI